MKHSFINSSCCRSNHSSESDGYVVITVIIFATIFIGLAMSLIGFVFIQHKAQVREQVNVRAFQVAEAGLDYYRWRLAHYPNDFTDGTGEPGPYDHPVFDPEGGQVGTAELEIAGDQVCGETTSARIISTGSVTDEPDVKQTVYGRYSRPSVAEYAFIINSNVWAGDDRVIHGRYHSNGGIHMDGENDSLVTSAKEEWECTSGFGCAGSEGTRPGIFGDGPNFDLWEFPVTPIDFNKITLDLDQMLDLAHQDGIRLNPGGGNPDKHGYHLILKADSTVDVYRVKKTDSVEAYNSDEGDHDNYEIITQEQFLGNHAIPGDCPVIFVQNRMWIEGEIEGKITVAAARHQPNQTAHVILNGDITYTPDSGESLDGLTIVSEGDISIPLVVPNEMKLNGVFIAQTGRFGRDHYRESDVDSDLEQYVTRNLLTINGTIVSNGRVGTQWVDGDDNTLSGFLLRNNGYDRLLAQSPPPFTPNVSEEYEFVEWREEN